MTKHAIEAVVDKIVAFIVIVMIIGGIFGVYKLLNMSWQAKEQVVSGIVYDASFDEWPGNNTTFKVRASVEMAVTEQTSETFCLPPDSQYIDIIRKAAEDKSVKVVVRVKKTKPHQRKSFWSCDDNTEVEIKEGK